MQQAISSQADLMGLIQEELQRYAADQANKTPLSIVSIDRWQTLSCEPWLEGLIAGMKESEQSVNAVTREVDRLLDRVYKTVSINDARRSIELNESLWRLSWVTFIFLPMTFLAGFFGMNVDIFSHNPDVKWYFIAVVPFMTVVLLLWSVFRSLLDRNAASKSLDTRRASRMK
ncbi:hypothetical protein LTR10_021054 [Elasticomyces elasticus]|uniref:Uncharacterized protein n=1 Tax=Exophiala sideris TaxID=1016849 RepID=A0ABR0JA21_9EURO|nr:hypothetical protein LTR10_021054 [Elasticomyces elasticus]KAK5027774.1 hypothetical protein LTS07_006649 [Exophiala sideris]KAK5037636.1 hypothetical protein LTR13_004795 [Exophiala sideris]KAK5059298.1 hypothetical protein LTR69_006588 [Exophiala sideris]KAK5183132.1 hypothetical protein LTR44_004843 [Eurotiomycetes sp. CCFEE 6388]